MLFLVATTSLPAVYRPKDDALTTTAGTPHARAKKRDTHTNLVTTSFLELLIAAKKQKLLSIAGGHNLVGRLYYIHR